MNLREIAIKGDGNCLFRAVSQQVFGTQFFHGHLRAMAYQHLVENRSSYTAFATEEVVQKELAALGTSGGWGGEISARVLADCLSVRIFVATAQNCLIYGQNDASGVPDSLNLVFLSSVENVHYSHTKTSTN